MSGYLMPAKNGTDEISIKRSRFICHVYRATTVEQANIYINRTRKIHTRASHNCVAYLIGENNEFGRADDDGEPNGTAGAPMLEVLQRQNIKNCLVVVTRYFGGVKLGAGGLIRAYGSAVRGGLKAVGLIRCVKIRSIWLRCDYSILATLQNQIKIRGHSVGHIQYSDQVKLEALVEMVNTECFTKWVVEFTNNAVVVEMGEASFKELPYEYKKIISTT